MGSLATNFAGFLLFFPVGVRRLLCSSSLYLKNPSLFRSKPWYFSAVRWKNLDLYLLLIALPIASFSQFFVFLSVSDHPSYRFSFFQQSQSLTLFWVLVILLLWRDYVDQFLIAESFVFVFAAIVFLVEYSVTGKGMTGLVADGVYDLMSELSLVCAGSCLVLSLKPKSYFAEFLLSCGLVFKGTWLLQAGMCLYTDAFALEGCDKMSLSSGSPSAEVHCELQENGLRGVALVNLLFVIHVIGVSVFGFLVFGLLLSFESLRCGEGTGPLLTELEVESRPLRANQELEMD